MDERSNSNKKAVSVGLAKSKVGGELAVTSQTWVVSLVRIPKSNYPEHVFLLIEGINEKNKHTVRRYDLVKHAQRDGYAKILITPTPEEEKEAEEEEEEIKVSTVAKLTKNQQVRYQSWQISPSQAAILHQDVLSDQKTADNFPGIKYSVFGSKSVLASSSSHEGHNCFTWAREKLQKLEESLEDNDKTITKSIKFQISDCIVAQSSLYLPDPQDSLWFNIKNITLGVGFVSISALFAYRGGFFSGIGNLSPTQPNIGGAIPTPLSPAVTPSSFSMTSNYLDFLSIINRI